jgi:alpha-galactosidase
VCADVNLDDCWAINERDAHNRSQPDPTKFPSGIRALSAYIHSLGLKFGIYSDAGTHMCFEEGPGGLGYETIDAKTYEDWEVDYLKYDDCDNGGLPYIPRYKAMRDALAAVDRPILYSMCAALFDLWQPMWSRPIGNSWRTTTDIGNWWASVMTNLDHNNQWWQWAGPGGWNDADMLRVGQSGLTVDEEISHFSLWCLIKSPLILGNDLRRMSQSTLTILSNVELIAINQDQLGVQGRCVLNDTVDSVQVWAVPLEDGDVAAILFNRHDKEVRYVTALWHDLGIAPASAMMHVRDLWLHQEMGLFNANYSVTLRPHASVTVRISATDPIWKTNHASDGRDKYSEGWQDHRITAKTTRVSLG